MTEPTHAPEQKTDDAAPAKQHGDPLLDTAQGRGDGEDGTRHGHDATGALPDESA